MSNNFNLLKVKKIIKETNDCVSVSFEVPDALKTAFDYHSGQYLTLEKKINGEDVRRSYSLCSAPYEGEWKVAIKEIENGIFSSHANHILQVDDEVNVMPPTGNFKLITESNKASNYVAFAAGSGITPIISMIKSVLREEPKSSFTLIYGNKMTDTIIFRDELEALKNRYMDRLSIHHILSKEKTGSPLHYGRIDSEKCTIFSKYLFDPSTVNGYYLCGPSEMVFAIKDTLKRLQVDDSKIHFELFTTKDIQPRSKKQSEDNFDPNSQSQVTLILDSEHYEFPLTFGGKSILEEALSQGIDLPFACKGGVCSTCKAMVMEGNVDMDLNYALENDEIERGFILTCQSHPRTSSLTVSFDEA